MPKRPNPQELVRTLAPEVILAAADICDGHSIFAPQAFIEAGLPPEVVQHLTHTHRSDFRGGGKSTLYANNRAVLQLEGVYGLSMLEFLADALGVKYRRCIGRGFQAAAIHEALRQHFASTVPTPTPTTTTNQKDNTP